MWVREYECVAVGGGLEIGVGVGGGVEIGVAVGGKCYVEASARSGAK